MFRRLSLERKILLAIVPLFLTVSIALHPNHPDPINPATVIRFDLSERSTVRLVVHDLPGREIAEVVRGERAQGRHSAVWDARGVAGGVYYYRLEVGGKWGGPARSMLLIR